MENGDKGTANYWRQSMRLRQFQEVSIIVWRHRGQDDILLEFGKLFVLPSSVWQILQPNVVRNLK